MCMKILHKKSFYFIVIKLLAEIAGNIYDPDKL